MLWIWVCVYVFKNHYSICLLYSILQTKVCILHIIVLSSSLLCALRCAIYYIFITFHIHGVWIELTTDEISFQISLHFKIQFNWEKIDWKEVNLLTEFFSQTKFFDTRHIMGIVLPPVQSLQNVPWLLYYLKMIAE